MNAEVTIIGAGPAGLAAAVQLQRGGIPVLLLEYREPGGLLRNANLVENYPGFPGGITGLALVKRMLAQAAAHDVEVRQARVSRLDWNGRHFRIETDPEFSPDPYLYRSKIVLIASGTRPRQFADFSLPLHNQERIIYEPAALFAERGKRSIAGKKMAIVGAGDAAFDYAINLAQRGAWVCILNRGEILKCLPLLWERSQAHERIQYFHLTAIKAVRALADNQLELHCSSPAGASEFTVDYLIGAIGRFPQLEFISASLQPQMQELQNQGRLYLIGDVRSGLFRQVSIAVGDGVRAAMQIYQILKENTP